MHVSERIMYTREVRNMNRNVQLHIRLTESEAKRWKECADKNNMNLSQYIRNAVNDKIGGTSNGEKQES